MTGRFALVNQQPCPLTGYSEKSARDKLARHRSRGDASVVALFHDECGQWHVERRPIDNRIGENFGKPIRSP